MSNPHEQEGQFTEKKEILRLYYGEGLSTPLVARQLGIAKQTVLYWIHHSECPISNSHRLMAGSKWIHVTSDTLDLLPLVNPCHLRWVDGERIVLRAGNSNLAVLSRKVSARDFFRLAGFYLAEGNKGKGPADLSNTNLALVACYREIAFDFVQTRIRVYDISASGNRAPKQVLRFGGVCLKTFFLTPSKGS
jgi:hypothetical protein